MGMIFAALAFGAATLVEINVVVRTNQHRNDLNLKARVPFGVFTTFWSLTDHTVDEV